MISFSSNPDYIKSSLFSEIILSMNSWEVLIESFSFKKAEKGIDLSYTTSALERP